MSATLLGLLSKKTGRQSFPAFLGTRQMALSVSQKASQTGLERVNFWPRKPWYLYLLGMNLKSVKLAFCLWNGIWGQRVLSYSSRQRVDARAEVFKFMQGAENGTGLYRACVLMTSYLRQMTNILAPPLLSLLIIQSFGASIFLTIPFRGLKILFSWNVYNTILGKINI